jgi:hypothetical protein
MKSRVSARVSGAREGVVAAVPTMIAKSGESGSAA